MSSTGEIKDAVRLAQQYNIHIYKILINGLMNSSLRVSQLKVELEDYNRSSIKFFDRLYQIRDSKIPFACVREEQIGVLRDQVKRNDRLKQEVHSIQRSLWNMREMGQRVPMANRHIIEHGYPELCVKNRSDQVPLTVLCDQVIRKYNLRQEKHIRAMLKWAEEESNLRKLANPVPKRVVQRNQLFPTPRPKLTPPQPAKPNREAACDVTPVNSNENISLDPNDGFAISPDDIRELDYQSTSSTKRKAESLAVNNQRSLRESNTKPDSDKKAEPTLVEKDNDECPDDFHVNFARPHQLFTWEELMLGFKRSDRPPAKVGPSWSSAESAKVGPSWSSAEPVAQPHQPEFVPEVRQWPIKITSVQPRSRPVKPKSVAEPRLQPNNPEYVAEPRPHPARLGSAAVPRPHPARLESAAVPRPHPARLESAAVPRPHPLTAAALYRVSQPATLPITQYPQVGSKAVHMSKASKVDSKSQTSKSKSVSKSQLSNKEVLSLWKSRLPKTKPVPGSTEKPTSGFESRSVDRKKTSDASSDKQRITTGLGVSVITDTCDGLSKRNSFSKTPVSKNNQSLSAPSERTHSDEISFPGLLKYGIQTNNSSNKHIRSLVGSDQPHVYENKVKRTGHSVNKSLAAHVNSGADQIRRRREEQLRELEQKRQRMKHMLSQKNTENPQRVRYSVHDKTKDAKTGSYRHNSSTSVPRVKGLGIGESPQSVNRKRPAPGSDSEPSAKRSRQEPGIVLKLVKKQSSWNVKQVFDRE